MHVRDEPERLLGVIQFEGLSNRPPISLWL